MFTDDASTYWQPILVDRAAQQAREAITAILVDLGTAPPPLLPHGVTNRAMMSYEFCVATGSAGTALLHSYAQRAGVVATASTPAAAVFGALAEKMHTAALEPYLFFGLTGIIWAMSYGGYVDSAVAVAPASETDVQSSSLPFLRTLANFVKRGSFENHFDLMRGVSGLIVFALDHLPDPAARDCIEFALDALESAAEHPAPDELVWKTPPIELSPRWHEATPTGRYLLGMAHGVAGVIGTLARVRKCGIAMDHTESIMRRAVNWLSRRCDLEATFPSSILPDGSVTPARHSWCHGEEGVAIALYKAGEAINETAWCHYGLAALERSARSSVNFTEYPDASNCHGTAGFAHMLNRAYQKTHNVAFLHAARHWFDVTLSLRRDRQGIGGFTYGQAPGEALELGFVDPSVLQGAAGTALSLAAAVSPAPPVWDHLFLLDM